MSDPGTELATRARPLPHEVADKLARQQASDGEVISALVREAGMSREMAAAWVRGNKLALDEARNYGCVELRRWLWSIAMPDAADAVDTSRVSTQTLRATELLARHHLGMTLEGAMDRVAKKQAGTGGKAA